MMTVESVAPLMARIARVKEELRTIKAEAEAEALRGDEKPIYLRALRDILKGQADVSEEDFAEAKSCFEKEGEGSR